MKSRGFIENLKAWGTKPDTDRSDLHAIIDGMIARFENTEVHPEYRRDMVKMVATAGQLAHCMGQEHYNIDDVMGQVADILQSMEKILLHAQQYRPRVAMYGIMCGGRLLPAACSTLQEAQSAIRVYGMIAPGSSYSIVQTELVCTAAAKPLPLPRDTERDIRGMGMAMPATVFRDEMGRPPEDISVENVPDIDHPVEYSIPDQPSDFLSKIEESMRHFSEDAKKKVTDE